MDIGTIPLFRLAEQRLGWLDGRQAVLAENVANADTPGWKARDVRPFDAVLAGQAVALARTAPGHIALADGPMQDSVTARAEQSPDGNTVALDEQLARLADTETQHDLATELYRKYLGLFRIAIGR